MGLIPTIKGEAPSIAAVTFVSQPKPSIVVFDDRAGKLQSENVRLTPTIKGEAPSIAEGLGWETNVTTAMLGASPLIVGISLTFSDCSLPALSSKRTIEGLGWDYSRRM